jgi:hypothetical protein
MDATELRRDSVTGYFRLFFPEQPRFKLCPMAPALFDLDIRRPHQINRASIVGAPFLIKDAV